MLELTVNGEKRTIERPMTVSEFLAQYNLHEKMVVAEYNLAILPRDQYAMTILSDGDNLEIVQMMAGG
jgi:sulfur carrier protein